MKMREFIDAMEYFGKKNDTAPKRVKVKKDFTLSDYLKFEKDLNEYLEWKKSKEPKKDEKKEEKKGFSTIEIAMFLIATFPITGPLYVWYVGKLLNIN